MRSYRRILLDNDLERAKQYMKGTVLDLGGGRKRGNFKEPDDVVWIVLDIEKKLAPHIHGNAQNIPLKSKTVDCVKCSEVLEHIEYPEKVIDEITRVLKPGGFLILSTPFLFNIHADPFDFQRFTDEKLKRMLKDNYQILMLKKQGLYFTVLAHMIKYGLFNSKSSIKHFIYPISPILYFMIKLDDCTFVKESNFLSSFTTGFFIIACKKRG